MSTIRVATPAASSNPAAYLVSTPLVSSVPTT
jgi:hypothetical protein